MIDELGRRTQFAYYAGGRLITVTDHLGTTTTTYNAVGNRLTESRANGMATGYAYDARNRLTGMSHINRDGQVVASFAYVLDAAGQRLSMLEHSGRMTGWAYDNTGKLIAESVQQSGYANRDSSYVYDAVGNRLEQTVAGVKTTYGYDANDRLSIENKAGLITDYTYDNQGNTVTETRQGLVTRHSYNAEHELVQSTKAGMSASYNYNLNGIRTGQTVNGISTHYVNDSNMPYAAVLMEIQNQQPVTTYTYGDDLISYHQGTGSQYYLYDGLGITRNLTSQNGQLTDQYTYDAYGETLEHQGSSNNAYQYTGEQKDVTGNYYLRARYYNPSVGRFTQMDTFEGLYRMPISLNKYIYGNSAPTMFIDPSGKISIAGVMAGINGQMNLQNARVAKAANQVKSMVSSLCKSSSQLAKNSQIHHAFPVFLGSTRKKGHRGDVDLDDYIHAELHKLTNLMFIINELPHPNRGREKFRDMFENERKDWKKALKVTKQTAKYVDTVCRPIVGSSYQEIEPMISEAMKKFHVYED